MWHLYSFFCLCVSVLCEWMCVLAEGRRGLSALSVRLYVCVLR